MSETALMTGDDLVAPPRARRRDIAIRDRAILSLDYTPGVAGTCPAIWDNIDF